MTTPPPSSALPTVIYVMGAGRSGSTILGVALGNCDDVFYAGELEAWLRRSGTPNFGGTERERFWSRVRQNVNGEDLFGENAWRYLEYSLAPFSIRAWFGRRRLRRRYRQVSGGLYREIAAAAGVTHVVDTSHYPLRAREMQRIGSINLYLIYLVRNPHDVAASFNRRDITNRSKSVLATNAYLSLTHLLSTYVFLRHRSDMRLLLRYEDFIANPHAMLRRVLDWSDVPAPLPDLAALRSGVPFQGNRLLESDTIALQGSEAASPARSYRTGITTVLQMPWALVLSRLGPVAASRISGKRAG